MYEADSRVGGHIHAVPVVEEGKVIYLDTGFMVFNTVNYPSLCEFFSENAIPSRKTNMSLSIQNNLGFEFTGSPFYKFFFQGRMLLHPQFIGFLKEIYKFNRWACAALLLHKKKVKASSKEMDASVFPQRIAEFVHAKNRPSSSRSHAFLFAPQAWMLQCTLGQLLSSGFFSEKLLLQYLFPLSGAIWSSSSVSVLNFPLLTLVKFLYNHGMLGVNTQYEWKVLKNRSLQYLEKVKEPFKNSVRLNTPVKKIVRLNNGKVRVVVEGGWNDYHKVVVATHANIALTLLDAPTALEKELLAPFRYEKSNVFLHSDESFMPRNRRIWSSWNVFSKLPISSEKNGPSITNVGEMSFHYYLNLLQGVKAKKSYFISLNPPQEIEQEKIIWQGKYFHPLLNMECEKVKPRLLELNKQGSILYCGSYFGNGFHEDAFTSGLQVANAVLKVGV